VRIARARKTAICNRDTILNQKGETVVLPSYAGRSAQNHQASWPNVVDVLR